MHKKIGYLRCKFMINKHTWYKKKVRDLAKIAQITNAVNQIFIQI